MRIEAAVSRDIRSARVPPATRALRHACAGRHPVSLSLDGCRAHTQSAEIRMDSRCRGNDGDAASGIAPSSRTREDGVRLTPSLTVCTRRQGIRFVSKRDGTPHA